MTASTDRTARPPHEKIDGHISATPATRPNAPIVLEWDDAIRTFHGLRSAIGAWDHWEDTDLAAHLEDLLTTALAFAAVCRGLADSAWHDVATGDNQATRPGSRSVTD